MTRNCGKKGNGAKKCDDTMESTKKLCFPEGKIKHKYTKNMVQCPLGEVWAHFKDIDEKETEPVIDCGVITNAVNYPRQPLCFFVRSTHFNVI